MKRILIPMLACVLASSVVGARADDRADGCSVLQASTNKNVFNWRFYLNAYPELTAIPAANGKPLVDATPEKIVAAACQHWLDYGIYEGRQAHPGFHTDQYLRRYSDLAVAFDPGKDPAAHFSPDAYVKAVEHYVNHGMSEGRVGYLDGGMNNSGVNWSTIQGNTPMGTIFVSGSARTAGAIDSVLLNKKEFINDWDRGRQLQVSLFRIRDDKNNPNYLAHYNPNEAGAQDDGRIKPSSSVLLTSSAVGGTYKTTSRPAFWGYPQDKSGYEGACDNTNDPTLCVPKFIFHKDVQIGIPTMPNVIRFMTQMDVSAPIGLYNDWCAPDYRADCPLRSVRVEVPTGYLGTEFTKIVTYNPVTKKTSDVLDPNNPGLPGTPPTCLEGKIDGKNTGCQSSDPLIFSTVDNSYAMGVCSTHPAGGRFRGPYYYSYTFLTKASGVEPSDAMNTSTKWSIAFELLDEIKGSPAIFNFTNYIVVANSIDAVKDVKESLASLYAQNLCLPILPPVCTSLDLSSTNLPAAGGKVKATAHCTYSDVSWNNYPSYAWTVNGNAYPGNADFSKPFENSVQLPANTTTSPITNTVCVTTTNPSGQSPTICAPVVQEGVTPVPTCSSVSLSPSSLSAAGGNVSAQANCTGSGLSYTWTVNGNVYPGNQASNSSPVSANTTILPITYKVCVTASNASGKSSEVCAPVVEAGVVPVPTCSSVSLSPSSLSAAGGNVSAQANCTGSGLSYTWTVNGNVYPGNQASNSSPVSANTTILPITYKVCVTASNASGKSSEVCAPVVEAGVVPVPTCSSVSLSPSSLSAAGGNVSAQANCTGSGLSYTWTVNGNVYPGNQASNSSPVSANTTTSPITYNVCVTASNAGGQSSAVCAPVIEAGVAPPAPPTCSSVVLSPSGLPASGGTVSAQANCSGSGLTYTWKVNGNVYAGNQATNSVSVSQNTTTAPIFYAVCVTASNAGGQATNCAQLVEASPLLIAPVCSAPTLSSNSLPASGGAISAQANCTHSGEGLYYTWFVNGLPFPGPGPQSNTYQPGNTLSFAANATASTKSYSICVVANDVNGQSQPGCAAPVVEAGLTSVLPSAPTIGNATAIGNGSVRVTFTPGALGTGSLVNYTANCGTYPVTGSGSPIIVNLASGGAYLCKVRATTTAGAGDWSDYSNVVFP